MIAVGANFKQGRINPMCPLCQESDTQSHLMSCIKLNVNVVTNLTWTEYYDLFSTSLDKKMAVVKVQSAKLRLSCAMLARLDKAV